MTELVEAAYYDDPLTVAAQRYWQSAEWQDIRYYMPTSKGAKALDVGAGRGIASYAMAKDGFSVTSLEPDDSALVGAQAIRQLAQDTGLHIQVVQDFSEQLPFTDCQFDVVFARAVLHHTRDLSAACKEFLRVLKPGGRLIAVREHVISKPEDLPAFFKVHPLHHLYGGENAFLLKQYQQALDNAGFAQIKTLAPFDSPINFAPHTLPELQSELIHRALQRSQAGQSLLKLLLKNASVWTVARTVLSLIDHRPGRLYSFIATRSS